MLILRKLILPFLLFFSFLIQSCNRQHKINSLFIEATPCKGTCPVFKMAVTQDRTVYYNAIYFNKEEGSFKTTLNQNDYDTLVHLLNATDFPHLKDKYAVTKTDAPTVLLTIMYDDEKIKKIEDYGKESTKELKALYDFIFKLRGHQQWIKTSVAKDKKDSAIKK